MRQKKEKRFLPIEYFFYQLLRDRDRRSFDRDELFDRERECERLSE